MQKRIYIKESKNFFKQAIQESINVLNESGIILYPTDTVYGIGCDFENKEAVKEILLFKESNEKKQMLVIADSINMAERYVVFDERARALAQMFWPGPLTLILPSKTGGTVGVRVPDNKFCLELLDKFGRPIISTSANISGMQTEKSIDEILKQFGKKSKNIQLIVDGGTLENTEPSTILDLTYGNARVTREGKIKNIENFLK